jgi:hypothetical protein
MKNVQNKIEKKFKREHISQGFRVQYNHFQDWCTLDVELKFSTNITPKISSSRLYNMVLLSPLYPYLDFATRSSIHVSSIVKYSAVRGGFQTKCDSWNLTAADSEEAYRIVFYMVIFHKIHFLYRSLFIRVNFYMGQFLYGSFLNGNFLWSFLYIRFLYVSVDTLTNPE